MVVLSLRGVCVQNISVKSAGFFFQTSPDYKPCGDFLFWYFKLLFQHKLGSATIVKDVKYVCKQLNHENDMHHWKLDDSLLHCSVAAYLYMHEPTFRREKHAKNLVQYKDHSSWTGVQVYAEYTSVTEESIPWSVCQTQCQHTVLAVIQNGDQVGSFSHSL